MAFADNRFDHRRRRLSNELAARRLDYMLVTNLINVRYLSGFSGSNAALLVGRDRSAQIATDGRYLTQVAEEVPDVEALIARRSARGLIEELSDHARVGVEATHLTVAELEALQDVAGEDVTLVPVSGLIEPIRAVKDGEEITALADVAELASQAFRDLLADGCVAEGRSELDVAADLEFRMRKAGSEHTSFDTIVASGPNSAKPHHSATDRILRRGDLVTIDFGAHVAGYNSDMTRTLVIGEANDFVREIYDIVLCAQLAGVEAATIDRPLVDLDAACRSIIEDAGYGEQFVHSTGHGIGLDVHEAPSASLTGEGKLQEGMTLTIEPGIYVPGKGGVRIEDTLVIASGGPRILTNVGKELLVV